MRHPISGCPPELIGFSPNSLTVKMEIEMTNPCPSCVETIADLKQAVSDAIHNAYVSGALDVHNNYQEDRDPSFGEAAADYVASLGVEDILAHFLPKSPAQAIAEECPHGMTEEAAQWVLDRLEQERKDECSTIPNLTKPTTDTDYVAVPRDVLGAACYIIRKSEHAESKTAETLREYALATPTDTAPRYVFGPWVERLFLASKPEQVCMVERDDEIGCFRRKYRIGLTYPHDGGECPLADGSVRVVVSYGTRGGGSSILASNAVWPNVTGFTALDEGKSA